MVVPFGISIGDFIAVGALAHDIAVALNDTRGAVAEYRSLIKLLESLVTSTQQITNFVSSSAACATLKIDQALANGLLFHVQCCRRLMTQFLTDSQKYTQSMVNGQGSKAKGILRKLKWKLYNSEDAQKLELRLSSHLNAFQTYLIAINIQFEAESTNRLESKIHQISYSLSEIHTLVAITQQNKPRDLGYQWEADPASSHIYLEDIIGRTLILPFTLCRNTQTFHDTLKIIFADHPGYQKVVKREFEIIDQDGDTVFNGSTLRERFDGLSSPPLGKVRPGACLEMNILITIKKKAPRDAMVMPLSRTQPCLICGLPSTGIGFRKCRNCDTTFRQTIKEHAGPNLEFPERWPSKVFKLKDALQSKERLMREVDTTSTESVLASSELMGLSLDSDWEQRHFRRIHYVIKYEVPIAYMANHFYNSRFPLIQAAGQGHARWVQGLLLNYDIDPNMRSFQGWTALQQACSATTGRPEAVAKMLIKHGAEVNATPGDGYALTALQAACKIGNEELVDILLEYDADIHATPASFGETALTAASRGGHRMIVDRLLKLGADVNQQAPRSLNALQAAAQRGDVELVERLVQEGADVINQPASKTEGATALQNVAAFGSTALMEELIEKGADVHAPGSETRGLTALQAAASQADLAKVRMLIEKYGADLNEPRSAREGYTALEAACCKIAKAAYRSRLGLFGKDHGSESNGLELIEYVLDCGARITPFTLHIAAAWGNLPMTRLLLHHGARITDPPDNRFIFASFGDDRDVGQTALETAKLNDRQEVVDLLQAWPAGPEDMLVAAL
ncbi:ankyrin [Mytilinidion resinicola]|uniref:Ankyrin n=1 Tax=Mytilinidion resinicola TaxID=574789 RepID=A0A6A6YRU2_9PEZI|nr:ankyrin [Mytilinidion resinicola]KAF2811278.1 ankyrin [Mytilinidion resinicola]